MTKTTTHLLAVHTRDREGEIARAKAAAEQANDLDQERHFDQVQNLAVARGEIIERPRRKRGEGRKPMRRVTGLEWLARKGKITTAQKLAGDRYGEDWRTVLEVSVKSGLDFTVRATSPEGSERASERYERASRALAAANEFGLCQHEEMKRVCVAVCGEGRTVAEVAGGWRSSPDIERTLVIGLDLLVRHYRL